jgi:outer membrane protein assembly factor BamB
LWAVGLASAEDWPQWLGPQRDSVWRETGILDAFPTEGPPVKWRQPIGGGYAGPAVANGRVFVADYLTQGDTTAGPGIRNRLDGTERVWCLSAADGRVLWKHEYRCAYHISYPAGPRVTPTVDGPVVYTLGAMGDLYCLKVDTGKVVWHRDLPWDYNAESPYWGYSGHPLVDGDKLFCIAGRQECVAVALNKHTGKELWRTLTAREPGYSAPAMIDAGGARQLLIWHPESLNSLDPETGKLYWSVPLDLDYGMAIATPRRWEDYVFVGGIVNKSMMLRLASDKPAAEVAWRGSAKSGIGPVSSTPFMEDGFLYGVDREGELRCVRVRDGEQLWVTYAPTTAGGRANSGTGFLVKNQDRFFIISETGDLVIARLSPRGYEEISRWRMIEPTGDAFGRRVAWSHPAFANRCVYARNDREIVCVSLAAEPPANP